MAYKGISKIGDTFTKPFTDIGAAFNNTLSQVGSIATKLAFPFGFDPLHLVSSKVNPNLNLKPQYNEKGEINVGTTDQPIWQKVIVEYKNSYGGGHAH